MPFAPGFVPPSPPPSPLPFWDDPVGITGSRDITQQTRQDAAWNYTFSLNPWDIATIGGFKLPGVSEIRGLAQLAVDNKKDKGKHGSTITITGYQPGPFEIVCQVWTPDQLAVLQSVLDEVWVKPQAKLRDTSASTKKGGVGSGGSRVTPSSLAKDVDHPTLQLLNIHRCIIQGVTFLEEQGAKGVRVIRFKCVEWRPVVAGNATNTPDSSDGVGVEHDLDSGQRSKNHAPEAPSKGVRRHGPKGPPSPPASGSD